MYPLEHLPIPAMMNAAGLTSRSMTSKLTDPFTVRGVQAVGRRSSAGEGQGRNSMVDNFSMLVSHGMLLFVLWRLLKLRDPEERPASRFHPDARGRS
jgi:hypothetical protein